jgi:hypothetical protein
VCVSAELHGNYPYTAHRDGTSDGTLGVSDIADRLTMHNGGQRPKDTEVLKLLLQAGYKGND